MTLEIFNKLLNKNVLQDSIRDNDLQSKEDFYEFFTVLNGFFATNNIESIDFCIKRLKYLGYNYNGNITYFYRDKSDKCILDSLIQVAFLRSYNSEDKKAIIIYDFLLNILRISIKEDKSTTS